MPEVQLGDRVKCKITGFSGIVTTVSTWLNGCVRIGVQPEEVKDGKQPEATYFDWGQLEVVQKEVHKPVVFHPLPAPPPPLQRTTGGPEREGPGFSR